MSEGRNTSTGTRTSDSPSPCRKPHVLGWAFAIVAALPLLYLLSVPAVLRVANIRLHPQDVPYRPRNPDWVLQLCKPYNWVMEHTALHQPLDLYASLIGPKQDPRWKKAEEMRLKMEASRRRTEDLMERFRELEVRWKQDRSPFRYPPRPGESEPQSPTPEPKGKGDQRRTPPKRDYILPPTIREPRTYQAVLPRPVAIPRTAA